MNTRIRLDKYLLDSGLAGSRTEAQAAIDAGRVQVNGVVAGKASQKVSADDLISAQKAHPYVSRAALKLEAALDLFPVRLEGARCLDIGCSTGGFTEVLLLAGAAQVIAVDVGTGQFHPKLKGDPRIRLFEQTDARALTAEIVSAPVDFLVCDASFIGLEKVLLPSLTFLKPAGCAILLFKPQFQVGPKAVGKRGIVSDMAAVETAKADFLNWSERQGLLLKGWAPSPVTGADGNQEYLVFQEMT